MNVPKKTPSSVRSNGGYVSASSNQSASLLSAEEVGKLIAELEVPFHPDLIEWRVMNTSDGETRGQIAPYTDQRAYTDRLNELLTPAGWTRRYTITTSANFERSDDKKLVAKVFVTCDLTIHGIGSHSATGEEWTDNDNAGTSAEAQAFKRACSCFGLGRYLYSFAGIWVDLDDRGRPKETPELFAWATPQGWRQGLRPTERQNSVLPDAPRKARGAKRSSRPKRVPSGREAELVKQIEMMAESLGRCWYRGLLKGVAQVWNPSDIRDLGVLEKVLTTMQSAERELVRLKLAQEKIGPDGVKVVLNELGIKSVDQIKSLDILKKLVVVLEEKTEIA
jgi:hypothetical protein